MRQQFLQKFRCAREQVSHLCKAALDVSLRNANRHKCNIIGRTGYIVHLGVLVLVEKPAGKRPLPNSRRGWEDNKYCSAGNVRTTVHSGTFLQPFLAWKSNKCYLLWVCVCSPRYPACNARAPYCHLWPAPLYNIFPHYLTNGEIFEKRLLNTKCVFWFYLQLLSETFFILRRNERDMIKNVTIWRLTTTLVFFHIIS